MKTALLRRNGFWLAFSLVLFLVSVLGASAVQTNGWSVTVKDLKWETQSGHALSALLYKPDDVSAEHPAPVVVAVHGMYNNRERQDSTYVELARRGYVVLATDMYAHGGSDVMSGPDRDAARATGVYDAIEYASTLPYIDRDRIGVTGHSYGGRSSNWSIDIDNERDDPLIAAVLLQSADGEYADPDSGEYFDKYGARDLGIVAAEYDEFFFRQADENGAMSVPRDFLDTDNAQSFLHFGAGPADISDQRAANEVYTESVDGRDSMRVIYSHPMIHPWVPFSKASTADVIDFFEQSFGAPHPIDSGNQIWQWKAVFNTLGLLAFVMFVIAFARSVARAPQFAGLRAAKAPAATPLASPRSRAWFWGSLVVTAAFSLASYLLLFQPVQDLQPGFRTQYPPLYIGIWAAVNGLFAVLVMWLSYRFSNKRDGLDLRASGALITKRMLWNTILAALVVSVVAYGIVFLADYLFKVDFRLWELAIMSFEVDRVWAGLLMLPLFLIFYIANSVLINVFGRAQLGGKEWLNTLLLAVFNCLSGVVVIALQYGTFFITGEMFPGIQAMEGLFMFAIVPILFAAAIISRKIYRATGNPYLAGIINGVIITFVTIANTQTLGV